MSSAYLLQHDELYPPGRLVPILRDFGIPTKLVRLDKGEPVPTDLDEVRMLILLGGRQRVTDFGSSDKQYLAAEADIAKAMVAADRPILGIGFGAELLTIAAGGKVAENRKPSPPAPPGSPPAPPGELTPEYGWQSVSFPFPGGTEPVMFGMIDNAPFFCWHTDACTPPMLPQPANPPPPPAPRPPTGNVVMAGTRICRTQAYKFKNRCFAFQFHFELEQRDIEKIIDARAGEAGLTNHIVAMKADTEKHYARYDRLSSKLVGNLVQFLKMGEPQMMASTR
jgi:GMP synthase (glutamine-hydrolysing)